MFAKVSRAKSRTSELKRKRETEGGRENVKDYICKCSTCVKLISEAHVMPFMCRASFKSQDCGVCEALTFTMCCHQAAVLPAKNALPLIKEKEEPPLKLSLS